MSPQTAETQVIEPIAFSQERSLRILVAEDNPVNQRIAIKMLEKLGHRSDVVANGVEAVQAAAFVPYDLILMDCQMPEMDGYEATRQIRESLNSSIPIIALTANATQVAQDKCYDAGMNDFVFKPVRQRDLFAVIERVFSAQNKQDKLNKPDEICHRF